jgi:hypothetical protein
MAALLQEGLNSFAGLSHRNLESVIGVAAEERCSPPFLLYADDGQTNLKRCNKMTLNHFLFYGN